MSNLKFFIGCIFAAFILMAGSIVWTRTAAAFAVPTSQSNAACSATIDSKLAEAEVLLSIGKTGSAQLKIKEIRALLK